MVNFGSQIIGVGVPVMLYTDFKGTVFVIIQASTLCGECSLEGPRTPISAFLGLNASHRLLVPNTQPLRYWDPGI